MLNRAKLRNPAKFRQTFMEIWPFFDFSRWQPPPSWILTVEMFKKLRHLVF